MSATELLFSRVTLSIPPAFCGHDPTDFEISAVNLGDAFQHLKIARPLAFAKLFDDAGQPRRFVNIFINETQLRRPLSPTFALAPRDRVTILCAHAGG